MNFGTAGVWLSGQTLGSKRAQIPIPRLDHMILEDQTVASRRLSKASKAKLSAHHIDSSVNLEHSNVHRRRRFGSLPNSHGGTSNGPKASFLQKDAALSIPYTKTCTKCLSLGIVRCVCYAGIDCTPCALLTAHIFSSLPCNSAHMSSR